MTPDIVNFPLLNNYAGFGSRTYNVRLRQNPVPNDLELEERLNLELDRLEPHSSEVVYAHDMYTSIPFEVLSKWYLKRIGSKVEFPNFLSTSNFRWPKFEGTVYIISTIHNSKARYINPVVAKDSEKEVLFKSRSIFQIEKVDTSSNTIYLSELDEAAEKITLIEGIFLQDDEIVELLKLSDREEDNLLSLSDLGII